MTNTDQHRDDLGDDGGLTSLAERLERERPLPAPGFRGELGRYLMQRTGADSRAMPKHLRARVTALAGSGVACFAVAAAGLAGLGPFAS